MRPQRPRGRWIAATFPGYTELVQLRDTMHLRPMAEVDPGKPARVYDYLKDDFFDWDPRHADDYRNWARPAAGVPDLIEYDGLELLGWRPVQRPVRLHRSPSAALRFDTGGSSVSFCAAIPRPAGRVSADRLSDPRSKQLPETQRAQRQAIASSTVSIEGDLWHLGDYRLCCPNALEAGGQGRLLDGERTLSRSPSVDRAAGIVRRAACRRQPLLIPSEAVHSGIVARSRRWAT
jgi:hypothetical protein